MNTQNCDNHYNQCYSNTSSDYSYPFYSPCYDTSLYSSNSSMVSNYYSSYYYSSDNEQMYSPTAYYNYYNNSYNSNDSGFLSASVQNSPNSIKTKLFDQKEDKIEQNENLTKKRKLGNDNSFNNNENDRKSSSNKRPKVLKLQNLESKDVEYNCEICLNVFNSAAKFLMHQFVHHKNGNSKQCPVCFRKFGSYSNAMVHLRGHTQEKLYQCKQCDKSFVDISTLKKHQRIHSGEKPFQCHICNKKFSQSGNLTRHLTTHTEQTGYEKQKPLQDQIISQNNQQNFQTYQVNNFENNYDQSYIASYDQYQSSIPQNYDFNFYLSY